MGGYYYVTEQGDMWDLIAFRVYGDEFMAEVLLKAKENRDIIEEYIFSQGVKVWCPFIEEVDDEDVPSWRDAE